jgi:hypothetical protein
MLLYILMVLCAAAMIYANGQAKSKGVAWGKPVAGLFGVMAVGMALLKIVLVVFFASAAEKKQAEQVETINNTQEHYEYSKMRYLGDYLGKNHPGETILLVISPYMAGRNKSSVKALKKGLKGRLTIGAEVYPENPDKTEKRGGKHHQFFTAEVFGTMLTKNDTCTLILSLIQLPTDFEEMEFWGLEEHQRPKMVLVQPNIYNLKKAIMGGYVNAVLHFNPNATYELNEEAPKDYKEAFAKRYLIIDKTNIGAISAEHPNLFLPDEEDED